MGKIESAQVRNLGGIAKKVSGVERKMKKKGKARKKKQTYFYRVEGNGGKGKGKSSRVI